MNNLRIPPQNLEAERAVIGAILIDSASMFKVSDILQPDFFYDTRHSTIYEFIAKLYAKGKSIDVITLTTELRKDGKIQQSGGATYLTEVITSVPTSANVEEYALIIKEAAVRRKLITLGGKMDELARKEEQELNDILNEVEKGLFALSQDSGQSDFYNASTLLEMQMKRADEYAKNPDGLRGLPTGIKKVDEVLGGLHKSDLIILAARPGVGKSAWGLDVLRHMAVNAKKSVAIFSLEMPAIQIIERMLSQQIRVDLWKLRMGKMVDDDYQKYSEGAGKLADSKIFVDDTPGLNIMQLRSKARKLKLEHDLDIVMIDYLQLMQGSSRTSDNRVQEISEISRSLKILARELDIPVVALSQLNRAVENRQDRIPQLSDLRESGSIEQDADLVIFLGRDVATEEVDENNPEFKVDVFIAKHRNGATGRFKLKFYGSQQKYLDFEE
jgi:replicative DNA helicase